MSASGHQRPLTIVPAQRPLLRVKRSLYDYFLEGNN